MAKVSLGRISYEDKVDYQQQGQNSKHKISAKDMNEIKAVFNKSAQALETNINYLDEALSKTGTYTFENGILRLRLIDGSYGQPIQLNGQSSVFNNQALVENLDISKAMFVISEGEGYIEVGNYEEYLKSLGK